MNKVIVGMSGGVDSSVAAYILKKQGYEVIGVTMKTGSDGGSDSVAADAAHVCEQIGIEHLVLDFTEEFNEHVKKYFAESYLKGYTPNPCIICNRYVKWQALLNRFDELGADYIATGHYAKIVKLDNGRFALKTASVDKDQTYALFRLTQEQLSKTIFPLGEMEKSQVREIAREAGLDVFDKPDSMEICFIPDHDYAKFIEEFSGVHLPRGRFVSVDGTELGEHNGISHYTIGQRKGLGIAFGRPMFVSEIRPETNEVVLSDGDEVFSRELIASDINAMGLENLRAKGADSDAASGSNGEEAGSSDDTSDSGIRAKAKIRYSHKMTACTIYPYGDEDIRVVFDEPVRAVTPGQSVVFYDDDGCVLGGGMIVR